MNYSVLTKMYDSPPINRKEILRYCGCKTEDESLVALINECLLETENKFSYKVCYCLLPVTVDENLCDFDLCRFTSSHLAMNLNGCDKAIIFCATVGIEIDRMIKKYAHISPTKALVFQAIGSERVESFCDVICKDLSDEFEAISKPRFSPGYGDLRLETQKSIFQILYCERNIGVCLNDSLLMTPSKSVTAIVGLKHR